MILRPFLNHESSCASYLFGCLTHAQLAVVDPHTDLVDSYLEAAAVIGAPITAVFETHVQADHVSGLPALVERTGARPYLPIDAGVDFEHHALADGDEVEMGNTIVRAQLRNGASCRCTARRRHRDGLPDAHCRRLGCDPATRSRAHDRRVPLLARLWLRRRRSGSGRPHRPRLGRRRHRRRRGPHRDQRTHRRRHALERLHHTTRRRRPLGPNDRSPR